MKYSVYSWLHMRGTVGADDSPQKARNEHAMGLSFILQVIFFGVNSGSLEFSLSIRR